MRVSKSGLVIAGLYVMLAVASIVYGVSLANSKDSSTMTQLFVIPALLVADLFGLTTWLEDKPWFLSLILFVPATAVVLYAACWLFGSLSVKARVAVGVCLLLVLAILRL